jgi:ABC-2 type transport system ATP-binding protein
MGRRNEKVIRCEANFDRYYGATFPSSARGECCSPNYFHTRMQNVLSAENLSRKYGDTVAVDGISFTIKRNEIVGLLGPNGAGKTTTINMVLGVLEPTAGSIYIEGINVARQRSKALNCTNFAAVYAPLPGNLTVYQNLYIFGLIYGVKRLTERIEH